MDIITLRDYLNAFSDKKRRINWKMKQEFKLIIKKIFMCFYEIKYYF